MRLRLRGYGTTSFTGSGFMLLGWSNRTEDSSVSLGLPFGPTFEFSSEFVYLSLALAFLAFGLGSLVVSMTPPFAKFATTHSASLSSADPVIGLVTLSGVFIGWFSIMPTVLQLPTGWAYLFIYGGLAGILLVWGLTMSDYLGGLGLGWLVRRVRSFILRA